MYSQWIFEYKLIVGKLLIVDSQYLLSLDWESVQKAILEENKNVGEFAQKYLRPYRGQKDKKKC